MKFLILFVLYLALADAMGPLKKWRRRALSKIYRRGKPFFVSLVAEHSGPARSAKKRSGWWSRLRASPSAKTKKTASPKKKWQIWKEMVEDRMDESSGDFPAEIVGNQTAEIFDEIEGRAHLDFLYKFETDVKKFEMHIGGNTYSMLLDTASDMGMIPQAGCSISNPQGNFGTVEPLWHPPQDDDTSRLREYTAHFSANAAIRPWFRGYGRTDVLNIAGTTINLEFVAATEISKMKFALMSASPHQSRVNMAWQILHRTNEPLKWFTTVFLPPPHSMPGAANGIIVFGGIDATRCSDVIYWMPDQSSATGEAVEGWMANADSTSFDSTIIYDQPISMNVDSGTPHLRLQTALFNIFMQAFVDVAGVTPDVQAGPFPVVPCRMADFAISFRVTDAASGAQMNIRLTKKNLLVRKGSQGDCVILITNGRTTRNLLGYPFYRSVCITHDFDRKRLGFAQIRRGAKI